MWTKFQLEWPILDANRRHLSQQHSTTINNNQQQSTVNNNQQRSTTVRDDDPRRPEISKITKDLAWAHGHPSTPTWLYVTFWSWELF